MRKLAAVLALMLICFSAAADERAQAGPSLRERAARIVRTIRKIFVPATLDDGITPPKPGPGGNG